MNVVIINSSPREQGNCSFFSKQLQEKYKDDDVTVFNLYRMDYKGCMACYACKNGDALCFVKDEMQEIYPKLVKADLIIMISPNYYKFVNGTAKEFLDRLFCMTDSVNRSKFKENAKFFFILCQGAGNRSHGEPVVQWLKSVIEHTNLKFYGYVVPGCLKETTDMAKLKYDDLKMSLNMFV